MKSIGEGLYALNRKGSPRPNSAYRRVSAKDMGLQESWFRDAIFAEPELVVGPCRSAGRVDPDEKWIPWRIEVNFGSGPIDVLLVSSHGRIGIVETKLSYNPQKRREVVAQVLDYALSLQECDFDDLPELPGDPAAPLAEDLADSLRSGRFLLVIAGDALDPRALRLSQSMLARHLTSEWDLAMIDLNVYQQESSPDDLVLVPELLGSVQADLRQVVRVVVQGESAKAKIVVDKIVHDEERTSNTQNGGTMEEFLGAVAQRFPKSVDVAGRIVTRMREIEARHPGNLSFAFRTGSANLYLGSSDGPRRFLSLRADGRLRLVMKYLRSSGMDEVVDRLVLAAAPSFKVSRDDHAGGLRFFSTPEGEIMAFLARVDAAIP